MHLMQWLFESCLSSTSAIVWYVIVSKFLPVHCPNIDKTPWHIASWIERLAVSSLIPFIHNSVKWISSRGLVSPLNGLLDKSLSIDWLLVTGLRESSLACWLDGSCCCSNRVASAWPFCSNTHSYAHTHTNTHNDSECVLEKKEALLFGSKMEMGEGLGHC